jgi:hypothetical protein
MTEPLTEAVYRRIRDFGDVGDVVPTDISPWLQRHFGMPPHKAKQVRDRAMRELKADGRIYRINVRGTYVRILS